METITNPISISKTEFKKICLDQTYTGWNGRRIRVNAFFFGYKQGTTPEGRYFGGYQFMVSTNVENYKKDELLDIFYQWVTGQISHPNYYVKYKYAETDEQRFKIPLSM